MHFHVGTEGRAQNPILHDQAKRGQKQKIMNQRDDENKTKLLNRSQVGIKQAFCITMYNEPTKQLLESLAGIYRNYYECVEKDHRFENNVAIIVIWDGSNAFNKSAEDDKVNFKYILNAITIL